VRFSTIEDLRSQLGGQAAPHHDPAYVEKMLHALPQADTVDREAFIVERCRGKRVLEFGASGRLHEKLVAVASYLVGIDREDAPGVIGFDLDDCTKPSFPVPAWHSSPGEVPARFEVIVCGEVLEHLSNPGWFLARIGERFGDVQVIISVPNAFSAIAANWVRKGYENVNKDHVAWYSPKTLSVLLERAGYTGAELHWYGGQGPTAEGFIVVTE
jgi:2-polyprenyl-3-methyl-5-hydroxy-6-metoxy-1,4-benzoquinol methylase